MKHLFFAFLTLLTLSCTPQDEPKQNVIQYNFVASNNYIDQTIPYAVVITAWNDTITSAEFPMGMDIKLWKTFTFDSTSTKNENGVIHMNYEFLSNEPIDHLKISIQQHFQGYYAHNLFALCIFKNNSSIGIYEGSDSSFELEVEG